MFSEMPGIDINVILLVFIALGAGVVSGFTGVGGAFFVTPALITLGFPARLAVGTAFTWVAGNTIIAVIAHRKLGHVDVKLGLLLSVSAIVGIEAGVRLLNWISIIGFSKESVLSIYICVLFIIGTYTLRETLGRKREIGNMLAEKSEPPPVMRAASISQKFDIINVPPRLHFAKSQISESLWIILVIGFFIGLLSGLIGASGGFLMVPALTYLVGIPSLMAAGTNLFQVTLSASYGAARHFMSGNVVIFVSLIMIAASGVGVQLGVSATRYIRGVAARFILAILILIVGIGSILKLIDTLANKSVAGFDIASIWVILSGMGLAVALILTLYVMAVRYRRGQHIPGWVKPLVAK